MGLVIQNVSGSELDIDDLGFGLATNASIDLALEADALAVATSGNGGDLQGLINSGDIVVKDPFDNITNLSSTDGLTAVRTHNDTHYRMPVGGRIADAIDVNLADPGTYIRYTGTEFVRATPAQVASEIQPEVAHNLLSGYVADEHATPKNSLQIDVGQVQLVNDLTSPGNNKVYGTTATGVKGWKDDPTGLGGGGGTPFTEAATYLGQISTTATWETIAVPGAPANSTVLIMCENPGNSSAFMGVREVGSTLDRRAELKAGAFTMAVVTNALSQVQVYSQTKGSAGFWYTGAFV